MLLIFLRVHVPFEPSVRGETSFSRPKPNCISPPPHLLPATSLRAANGHHQPIRPTRRPSPSRPLIHAGQGGRIHCRALSALTLAVAPSTSTRAPTATTFAAPSEEALRKSHLFTRHVEAALASAAASGVRTRHQEADLALHVEELCYDMNVTYNTDGSRRHMVTTLLSNPAARTVDEFSFAIDDDRCSNNLVELRFGASSMLHQGSPRLHLESCYYYSAMNGIGGERGFVVRVRSFGTICSLP